jgi:diaminopimelate epimerase
MRLSFEKWEGLGNDFVLVRDREAGVAIGSDLVRRICDRRHGVGADGVLVVGDAPPEMVVLNADGSRPEMCGNGLRCVAALLAGSSAKELAVRTDAGERVARVSWTGPDEALVEVEMGRAEIGAVSRQSWGGREITFGAVSVGNPHAITFDGVEAREREELGRHVERATPGGTNVEFARQTARDAFEVVVWERGVGFTQACGTGACATAALACVNGAASFGVPVKVALPGGELAIHVSANLDIVMLGPARRVFRGTLEV